MLQSYNMATSVHNKLHVSIDRTNYTYCCALILLCANQTLYQRKGNMTESRKQCFYTDEMIATSLSNLQHLYFIISFQWWQDNANVTHSLQFVIWKSITISHIYFTRNGIQSEHVKNTLKQPVANTSAPEPPDSLFY